MSNYFEGYDPKFGILFSAILDISVKPSFEPSVILKPNKLVVAVADEDPGSRIESFAINKGVLRQSLQLSEYMQI